MRIRDGLVAGVVAVGLLPCCAVAQGTKQWTVTRYDEMERGTADGVAIRSDGRLEAGPASSLLYATGGNYVWSVAADSAGNAYVGMGGTAAGGAIVMRVAPDKKAVKVFESKELGVQALRVGSDGSVYAATLPDGKVYRLGSAPADAVVVFDPALTEEKPKYLWSMAQVPAAGGKGGEWYVATGAPAVVYRIPAGGGKAEVAFKTVDQHIRCLLMTADGTLWAGTDGGGVIYRLDTKKAGAKPFAVYAAPKREITALAMDASGNVYAAGVGAKPTANAGVSAGLPPLPVTGAVGVTVTFSQPGSTNATTANTLIPDGSEIYRIATDGSTSKLVALKEDVVYALAVDDGALLAATGNRGRIYRVDIGSGGQMPEMVGRYTDVAHLEAAQGTAFAAVTGGQIVGTSNSGKVFHLDDRPAASSTYTSEVFDAGGFAQWGRFETEPAGQTTTAAGAFELFERTGNVESPLMGWSDWTAVAKTGIVTVPPGRFAQWKAVLHEGAKVESVAVNYLQKNIAPVVDDVVVQVGARVAANAAPLANTMVQVSFPAPTSNLQAFVPDMNAQPLMAQKDKTGVTIRWAAHDENGDDLIYSVWYRGVGEKNWRLLREKVTEKFLSFDSSLLPDGQYEMRVLASDSPAHVEAEGLTGERVSGTFVVDTTPPVPGTLVAGIVAGVSTGLPQKIHATFSARDATSPIAHAEYAIDAGQWQYLEPVGRVSDALEERYDFTAAIPVGTMPVTDAREHVIAVRVYDRMENVVSVKAVVR